MEPYHTKLFNIYDFERVSVVQCDSSSGNAFPPVLANTASDFSAPSNPSSKNRSVGRPSVVENAGNAEELPNMPPCGNNSNGKTRVVKVKARRHKANARERNRMHGLNAALDRLRRCIPIHSRFQKLSKIETLRLARNYIGGMSDMLKQDAAWDIAKFTRILTNGMSQGTSTAITSFLNLNPRTLFPPTTTDLTSTMETNEANVTRTPNFQMQLLSPYKSNEEIQLGKTSRPFTTQMVYPADTCGVASTNPIWIWNNTSSNSADTWNN